MSNDLKKLIEDRMSQLEMTPYQLAIAYGKIAEPDFDGTERDIGNKYLSRIKKAISQPEKCQLDTLKTIFKALKGNLVLQMEFVDTRRLAV